MLQKVCTAPYVCGREERAEERGPCERQALLLFLFYLFICGGARRKKSSNLLVGKK